MSRFLLLGRPGCGLCAEFEAELRAGFPDLELDHADVDERPGWARRWGLKIPVLLAAGGEPVCVSFFDAAAVEQARARS